MRVTAPPGTATVKTSNFPYRLSAKAIRRLSGDQVYKLMSAPSRVS